MKGKNVSKVKDAITKEEFYIKKLNSNEKKFYEHIYESDIAPEFSFFKDEKDDDYIKMKSFGTTLAYYIDLNEFMNIECLSHILIPLNKKIQKLHDLGIVHIDLHTKNILVDWVGDSNKMDVKIIDFDLSRFVDDLCDEDFDDFKTFLPKFDFEESTSLKEKINYLLDYEYEMWKMDYF
jgi:serine/threonine protein kinase